MKYEEALKCKLGYGIHIYKVCFFKKPLKERYLKATSIYNALDKAIAKYGKDVGVGYVRLG